MIKLFTDSDLDGIGCGLVAKIAFGENVDIAYCSYRNLNERVDQYIENSENNDAKIYITDLSVNESVEKKLNERFKSGKYVQMVDHHKTAMHFNDYEWGFVQPEYESGKKTCATSLFYEFLLDKKLIEKNASLEEFIELVRQYDTWEWEINNNLEAKRLNDLFYILNIERFEETFFKRLTNSESFSLTENENLLLDIEDKKIERYIYSKSRQTVQTYIDDCCVGIVHAEQYISELGNALGKIYPHLDLIAILNVGTKKVGLRTIHDHIDVSQFAQRYGGGGHPKASGCFLSKDAFEKMVIDVFELSPLKRDAENNELNNKKVDQATVFSNKNGQYSIIYQVEEGKWNIIHDKKRLEVGFKDFQLAETFLKRNYASGLCPDSEAVSFFVKHMKKKEEEVIKNYETIVKKYIKKYN
ncbi:oligoribonuclease [Bacillus timonensis]|nr:oligoribonuclease [Bacillus timonensis]